MLARHHLVAGLDPQIEDALGLKDGLKAALQVVPVRLGILLPFPIRLLPLCLLAEPVQRCKPDAPPLRPLFATLLVLDVVHLRQHLHDFNKARAFVLDFAVALLVVLVVGTVVVVARRHRQLHHVGFIFLGHLLLHAAIARLSKSPLVKSSSCSSLVSWPCSSRTCAMAQRRAR